MVTNNLSLKLGWFYPDLMSTYGDYGNVLTLQNRAAWAGIKLEVVKIEIDSQPVTSHELDLVFMGGSQDRQQSIASKDLIGDKRPLIQALMERGVPGLFICGAYQLMGDYYLTAEGETIEGLKFFNLYTKQLPTDNSRLIGPITIRSELFPNVPIVGFENHGGRTYIGSQAKPFGRVLTGHGNNGQDQNEGVIHQNFIGTYLHGPILPVNPVLTDWLLKKAIEIKYGPTAGVQFSSQDFERITREHING